MVDLPGRRTLIATVFFLFLKSDPFEDIGGVWRVTKTNIFKYQILKASNLRTHLIFCILSLKNCIVSSLNISRYFPRMTLLSEKHLVVA